MAVEGIAVRLELPERAVVGTPISVRLVITNLGDERRVLVTPRYNGALNIVVFDKYWDQVAPDSVGKAHSAYEHIEFPPSAARSFVLDDLTYTSGTTRMAFNLPTGVYYVLAVYHPGTDRLPENSDYPIAVASNVQVLTVE